MWNTNLNEAPLDKYILLKCQYGDMEYEILATLIKINKRIDRGEVAERYKDTEKEEMFYRSAILAWNECDFCTNIIKDNLLNQYHLWIECDYYFYSGKYVENIKYCPMCGRRLDE